MAALCACVDAAHHHRPPPGGGDGSNTPGNGPPILFDGLRVSIQPSTSPQEYTTFNSKVPCDPYQALNLSACVGDRKCHTFGNRDPRGFATALVPAGPGEAHLCFGSVKAVLGTSGGPLPPQGILTLQVTGQLPANLTARAGNLKDTVGPDPLLLLPMVPPSTTAKFESYFWSAGTGLVHILGELQLADSVAINSLGASGASQVVGRFVGTAQDACRQQITAPLEGSVLQLVYPNASFIMVISTADTTSLKLHQADVCDPNNKTTDVPCGFPGLSQQPEILLQASGGDTADMDLELGPVSGACPASPGTQLQAVGATISGFPQACKGSYLSLQVDSWAVGVNTVSGFISGTFSSPTGQLENALVASGLGNATSLGENITGTAGMDLVRPGNSTPISVLLRYSLSKRAADNDANIIALYQGSVFGDASFISLLGSASIVWSKSSLVFAWAGYLQLELMPLPLTDCEACEACLELATPFTMSLMNETVKDEVASIWEEDCGTVFSAQECDVLTKMVRQSVHGSAGRRAGMICSKGLSRCSKGLAAKCSIELDLCSADGISTSPLPDAMTPPEDF
eukprot:gene10859-11013_t